MSDKNVRNFSMYLALLIINGLLMAGAPASANSKVESLHNKIENALDLFFQEDYLNSQANLDSLLPDLDPKEYPNEYEWIGALQLSNSIATDGCTDLTPFFKKIREFNIEEDKFYLVDYLIVETALCVAYGNGLNKFEKFEADLIKILNEKGESNETRKFNLVEIQSESIGEKIGLKSKADYLINRVDDFTYHEDFRSLLFDRAINLYLELGSPQTALELSQRWANELSNSEEAHFSDFPLSQIHIGNAYADLEKFEESEDAASTALKHYLDLKISPDASYTETVSHNMLGSQDAYILNHLGLLLDRQNRIEEAIGAYQLGILILKKNFDATEDGAFYFDLVANYGTALGFLEGQEDEAKYFIQNFLREERSLVNQHPIEHANFLNVLGILEGQSENITAARDSFLLGIDVLEKSNLQIEELAPIRAQLLNNLSTLPLQTNEIEKYLLRAISDLNSYQSENANKAQVYANLGVLYLENNDTARALEVLDELETQIPIKDHFSRVINFLNAAMFHDVEHEYLDEDKLSELLDWNAIYLFESITYLNASDIHVWLPYLQSRWDLAGRTFESILHYCDKYQCDEDFKFQSLVDMIQISETSIISIARQMQRQLDKESHKSFAGYIASYFHQPNFMGRLEKTDDASKLAELLLDSLDTELFNSRVDLELVNANEIEIPSKSAIIKFFDTGENLYRLDFSANKRKITRLSVAPQDVARLYSDIVDTLFQSDSDEVSAMLQSLGDALFEDFTTSLAGLDTIFFSGEVYMRSLPASTLVFQGDFLADTVAVVSLPAFSTDFMHSINKQQKFDFAFMGFGAPNFSGNQLAFATTLANEDVLRGIVKSEDILLNYPPLPGALGELISSKEIFGKVGTTKLLHGETATRQAVLTSLSQNSSKLISFATHGISSAETDASLYPSLLFRSNGKNDANGLLSTKDILQTRIQADVVYLSSCNSASKNTDNSRHWEGFVNSFLYAGANSIIASSWKIEDQAAKIVHTKFAEFFAMGLSPKFALNKAINHLREYKEYAHPKYWGAFSIFSAIT